MTITVKEVSPGSMLRCKLPLSLYSSDGRADLVQIHLNDELIVMSPIILHRVGFFVTYKLLIVILGRMTTWITWQENSDFDNKGFEHWFEKVDERP